MTHSYHVNILELIVIISLHVMKTDIVLDSLLYLERLVSFKLISFQIHVNQIVFIMEFRVLGKVLIELYKWVVKVVQD